jgi:hypothetical protein
LILPVIPPWIKVEVSYHSYVAKVGLVKKGNSYPLELALISNLYILLTISHEASKNCGNQSTWGGPMEAQLQQYPIKGVV